VRKLLVSGLEQEYGARLVEALIKSAVLTLPSYTYTDIGRLTLRTIHLTSVKMWRTCGINYYWAGIAVEEKKEKVKTSNLDKLIFILNVVSGYHFFFTAQFICH